MKKPLSNREQIILKLIRMRVLDDDRVPLQSELAKELSIHRQSLRASLLNMHQKGHILLGNKGEIKLVD